MGKRQRRIKMHEHAIRNAVPAPPVAARLKRKVFHGLARGDIVALQIHATRLQAVANLLKQAALGLLRKVMQRLKRNRRIKRVRAQIARQIVRAKERQRPPRMLGAQLGEHPFRQVHAHHMQRLKAGKDRVQLQPRSAAEIQQRFRRGRQLLRQQTVLRPEALHVALIAVEPRLKKRLHGLKRFVLRLAQPFPQRLVRAVRHRFRTSSRHAATVYHDRAALFYRPCAGAPCRAMKFFCVGALT